MKAKSDDTYPLPSLMNLEEFIKKLGNTLEKMKIAEDSEHNGEYIEVVCMNCKWQEDSKKLRITATAKDDISEKDNISLWCPECGSGKIHDVWKYNVKKVKEVEDANV